ncbi:MAG TPA: cellulase family glycosylhydrolase [Verrucomicrobiae bacterium]|jgi:hypothetical protein|nr:cellulase family glycosylhydrolase [Verrucomicrobiae bacterium]
MKRIAKAMRLFVLAFVFGATFATASPALEPIVISPDGRHFALAGSGLPFQPWGFNYDRDTSGRLLEDYWQAQWPVVEKDFTAMKALGANVVRIHLQLGKFMQTARKPDRQSLDQLARLLRLAQDNGLYLDLTGLGCYNRKDVPAWFNALGEKQRWDVQSRFWEAVSETCAHSPTIFCYDLMNEPLAGGAAADKDWTPGEFAGKCYVQRLTLDLAGRTDKQVAKAWVDKMAGAIRKHDKTHLLTVGAIPWALTWPTAKPLFYSREVGKNLDFISLHFYPKTGEVDKALKALAVYNVGKPIVIEEMFPLNCSMPELSQFIDGSRKLACGWIGFYWGESASPLTSQWLEYFVKKANDSKSNKKP